ncbi:hypothetical protein M5K25_013634 [Dendrobium thyrsiflorum]|uniref:Uncharacterized protein n=1 Tax=Dendrobium thyrsiflorum TaxID=117978 RepID=A0ABD0UUK0_DENTH
MASSQSENPNTEADSAKALIYSYSNRTWRAFLDLLPSPDSSFLAKISNLYPQGLTAGFRKRRSGLPLLLHPNALHSSPVAAEASRIFVILEDIRAHTLSNLHKIHKSLAFWQARAVETDYQKVWFMVFNRGPRAFIYESFQIIRKLTTDGHPFQSITHSAADTISLKIAILTTLQRCLATFLAQVYLEVNKFGELLIADSDKSLLPLLVAIDNLFCKLEASISHPCEIYNSNNDSLSMGSGNSCALLFEKLPKMEHVQTQWTDTEMRDATSLIHQNLQRLDSYLLFMLSSCQKPNRMTLYWLRYTCGAVGLSACSFWVLRHSSLMGSSDIDNWIRTAKESTTAFWEEHVELPPEYEQAAVHDEKHNAKAPISGAKISSIAKRKVKLKLVIIDSTSPSKNKCEILEESTLYSGKYDAETFTSGTKLSRKARRKVSTCFRANGWEMPFMIDEPLPQVEANISTNNGFEPLRWVKRNNDNGDVKQSFWEAPLRSTQPQRTEEPVSSYPYKLLKAIKSRRLQGVGRSWLTKLLSQLRLTFKRRRFQGNLTKEMLISIRDELFETFRKRHKGVMEMEEVQLTANSLHRMLLAFSEQTKGQKLPENLTDQEMMEIVMSRMASSLEKLKTFYGVESYWIPPRGDWWHRLVHRYEKEVMHPLQNLIGGELARAMLIQIQKLKLDLETAMLELDQILKANEINFAVLAALPAFFISLILLYLVRTWVLQDKGEEGRGRVARIRRRLLLVEVEEWIMQFQVSMEQGMEEDAAWIFGMMLYSLDLLCKAVEKNAKETHEWPSWTNCHKADTH